MDMMWAFEAMPLFHHDHPNTPHGCKISTFPALISSPRLLLVSQLSQSATPIMPPSSFSPYRGEKKALVISIDVGTTYSGMSYAILDPGEIPEIKPVLRYVSDATSIRPSGSHREIRYPGRENAPNDYRVPTVVCYRPNGTVHACGAEAEDLEDDVGSGLVDLAEDESNIERLVFVRR